MTSARVQDFKSGDAQGPPHKWPTVVVFGEFSQQNEGHLLQQVLGSLEVGHQRPNVTAHDRLGGGLEESESFVGVHWSWVSSPLSLPQQRNRNRKSGENGPCAPRVPA